MAIYGLNSRGSSGILTNKPAWSLQTTANHAVRIVELKVVTGSATATELSLGLASSTGTQSSSATAKSLTDLTTASTSTLAVTFSVDPGVPAAYIEGWCFPATIGSAAYWSWPDENGLIVPAGNALVLWNTGAGTNSAIMQYSVKFEEL